MTAAVLVPVTCGYCGSDLHHVTQSRATTTEASAVVACGVCRCEFQVHVRLLVIPDERRQRASVRRAELRAELRAMTRQAVGV